MNEEQHLFEFNNGQYFIGFHLGKININCIFNRLLSGCINVESSAYVVY